MSAAYLAGSMLSGEGYYILGETIWLSFWFAQPEKFKKVACSEVPIVGYPAFAGGTYPVG